MEPRFGPAWGSAAPLPLGPVICVGLGIAAVCVYYQGVAAFPRGQSLALSSTLATAAVLVLLVSISRSTAAGQILGRWLQAVWAGCFTWNTLNATGLSLASVPARRNTPGSGKNPVPAPHIESFDPQSFEPESFEPEENNELDPEDDGEVVLQHVVRVRDASGRESVHATLRGEVEPGQRRITLHLGFCPPLATRPEVEAEIMEGPAGVAKVIQALHNGVQVEVELDEASLETTVVTVEVAASESEE